MNLLETRVLPGPNIYTHRPVLVALVDLGGLAGAETHRIPGFTDGLLALLPGLGGHHCGLGYPGGFVERLRGGTYFGHVVEHVALELQALAGCEVSHGKTRQTRTPGVYRVVVECCNEACGRLCLEAARQLVEAVLDGRGFPVVETVAEAKRVRARTGLGPSTKAIADAAARRGIPVVRLDEGSLIQLGYGKRRELVHATETQLTSSVSADIACDKARTKAVLERALVPVPRGTVVRTEEDTARQLVELSPPLAVKPLGGNQGKGVTLGVRTADEARLTFQRAAAVSAAVVVEEQFAGRDYRVLVIDGRVAAASERVPAQVVGDGRHTVAELVEVENATNPLRGDGHDMPLSRLELDESALDHLRRAGRSPSDVPAAGERVALRATANLSTGGTARDVTDEVHPATARLCERAARVVGLDVCGIDLITPDIAEPLPEIGAGVIEVNAAPGIRMHHYPAEGKPRDAGAAIVDMLYPPGKPSRVPVASITGTNGKTTVTRMVADAVALSGKVVGVTTTDGIWVGGHRVAAGDMTGFHSCRLVLGDPAVEAAVLETARGGIVRRSLGYDWSDVGVLTNIAADHLGQDGIETIEDLVHVKALVAERVRDGGTLVLNADDPLLVRLPQSRLVRADRKTVVYFTLRTDNPVVLSHLATGGTAYWAAHGWLVEGTPQGTRRLVREDAIPATFGGAARFQVANALAAAATARAMGVSAFAVGQALEAFDGGGHNPGRLNLFKVGRGFALVDYGHNPAAFEAVARLAREWRDRRVTAVVAVPGDRDDELIREGGRAAARGFGRVIVKEDADPPGRARGDIARLLCEAIREVDRGVECTTVLDEREAVRAALEAMADGEVVVVFHDDYDGVMAVLRAYGAVPAAGLPRPAVNGSGVSPVWQAGAFAASGGVAWPGR